MHPNICWLVKILRWLCFYVSQLNHYQIDFVIYSLVLMSILNNLFCCLQILHQFYFSSFPWFYQILNFSLTSTTLFHPCHHFFWFYLFCVLNSIMCWIQVLLNWIRFVCCIQVIIRRHVLFLIKSWAPIFWHFQ